MGRTVGTVGFCFFCFIEARRHPGIHGRSKVYNTGVRIPRRKSGYLGASQFIAGEISCVSPLTPALSPLRGEGVAADALGRWTGRAAFGHRSEPYPPNAGNELRYSRIAGRAPSPLKGERAGVRGEAVRLACPAPENEMRPSGYFVCANSMKTRGPLSVASACCSSCGPCGTARPSHVLSQTGWPSTRIM